MALSDFTGPDYIDAWSQDLDARWPERAAMADCVVRTLARWRSERRGQKDHQVGSHRGRHLDVIRLLELGIGAGGLARSVLDTLTATRIGDSLPGTGATDAIEYTGIDIEAALVGHVEERLGPADHRDARLICADLKDSAWPDVMEQVDAAYSLQTFHDLGGIDALEAVYRQIHGLLVPGGILVNADFVVSFEKDDPDRPRRLPVETHQGLLTGLGFVDFRCELQLGKMACMSARRA